MRWITRHRPTPALIVAFIALFVAMSGVGYTAAKLNGKRLKNRSVSGSKLKNDTVTGTQANESTFGTVPSATSATSAANATNAANAGLLDNLNSTAFERSSTVVGGPGIPTSVPAQTILTASALGLRLETDGDVDAGNNVVARNVGSASMFIVFGTGAGDSLTVAPGATTTLAPPNDWVGADEPGVFEMLIFAGGPSGVLKCYFPNDAAVGFDYCQAATGTP